jgi:UDP-glucose 4-epimerase
MTFLAKIWPVTRWSAMATRIPVIGGFVAWTTRPFFKPTSFHLSYIPVNREVAGGASSLLPRRVIHELVERSAHRVIIRRCTCRDSEKCKNYPVEEACLLLGEDTALIDPRVADHVDKAAALAHLDRMLALGLTPFTGRIRMDDFFWGVPNRGRMLTICFCCTCCCTVLRSARYFPANVAGSMVRLKGLAVTVDRNKCVRCGTCVAECFMKAITLDETSAVHDEALCKGCGRCAAVCPHGAVTIDVENVDAAVADLMGRIGRLVRVD